MDSKLFKPARRSIARGRQHTYNLHKAINAWFDRRPYALVREPHADGLHDSFKFRLTKQFPPSFEATTADALYNLRASLDQAIFAIADVIGGVNPRDIYFPFSSNEGDFNGAINGKFGFLPKEIRELICSCKPYLGGNDTLWALNEACKTNKHRFLTKPGFIIAGFGIHEDSGHDCRVPPLVWDRSKNEMTVYIVSKEYFGNAQFNLPSFIGFEEIPGIANRPVVEVLYRMRCIAQRFIIDLESAAHQLGLTG
ncbi:hypothetical protein [Nitrospira sp. Nam80]